MLQRGLTGTLLISAVMLCRLCFSKWLSKRNTVFLWTVTAAVLLLPFSFSSPLSLYAFLAKTVPLRSAGLSAGTVPLLSDAGPFLRLSGLIRGGQTVLLTVFGLLLLYHFFRFRGAQALTEHEGIRRWAAQNPLRRPLRIICLKEIRSPLCFGIFFPVIVLTPEALDCRENDLECILQHEYLHICRFDPLRKILFAVCACVYWYHPLVWGMLLLAGRDLEYACDESMIEDGFCPKTYCASLLRLKLIHAKALPLTAAFRGSNLEKRLKRIRGYRERKTGFRFLGALLTVLILPVFGAVPLSGKTVLPAAGTSPYESISEENFAAFFPENRTVCTGSADRILTENGYSYDQMILEKSFEDVPLSQIRTLLEEMRQSGERYFARVTEAEGELCTVSFYVAPEEGQ